MMNFPKRFHFFMFLMIVSCSALLHTSASTAQNAPVTTLGTVGNALPGQVTVPLTVTGFTDIGAVSLTFDYQYAGLHFVQGDPNPALPGFAIGDQNLGNGKHRVTMGWFGNGTNLPDGTVIMNITFIYINGITSLEFYDSGPSCEYADGNYNVLNDLPQSTFYINGIVCGGIGSPGTIAGEASVCQGETGVVYSISPLPNATGYSWSLPPGATILNGNNTNSITAGYSATSSSGTVTVHGINPCGSGPASQLPVVVNPLPVASAGPDLTIPYGTSTLLHAASGGSGTFNYHWAPEALLINPDLQDPQTINLTVTSVFTLTVTNQANLCEKTDEVIVTITGGPLNSNPLSIPGTICKGTPAQLFANAGGGSGNYSYAWSSDPPGTPPWNSTSANPTVFPVVTTTYTVTVSDGFNSTAGSTSVLVHPLPSATIQGGDTLCGEGNSAILTVNLTGTPPWNFYYSNGVTTWFVGNQYITPYQIFTTEPGNYAILAVTDEYCTGNVAGSAVVGVYPIPPTPVISVNGTELSSSGCCGNQWYLDGTPIPGATGQNHEPLKSAHYFTIVTVDGCSSDTSNTIFYFMTGNRLHQENIYSIGPNPASELITVKAKSGMPGMNKLIIYTLAGKEVMKCLPGPQADKYNLAIDIRQLTPGMYLMEINSDKGKSFVKFAVE